jgi:hypothetical protein
VAGKELGELCTGGSEVTGRTVYRWLGRNRENEDGVTYLYGMVYGLNKGLFTQDCVQVAGKELGEL